MLAHVFFFVSRTTQNALVRCVENSVIFMVCTRIDHGLEPISTRENSDSYFQNKTMGSLSSMIVRVSVVLQTAVGDSD